MADKERRNGPPECLHCKHIFDCKVRRTDGKCLNFEERKGVEDKWREITERRQ